ncbi:MAG: transcriptional regulator [Polyangiaceae bacterium]|nr:transcriptional regulator [Polyangiaceae bacterium]
MTLRLVKPEGPRPLRRKGERSALLTPDEERRFRQGMRNLHIAFGSWGALAAAMGTRTSAISHMMAGRSTVSGDMMVRAMRASGLSLGELLGVPVPADRCRACGQIKRAS